MKLCRFSVTALVLCLSICSILTITIGTRLYKNEKFEEIKGVSNLLIDGIKDEYELSHSLNSSNVTRLHSGFSTNYKIRFFIYDSEGNCILTPDEENNEPIADDIKDKIDEGSFIQFDAEELSANEQSILYGTHFTIKESSLNFEKYYLVAYSPIEDIEKFTAKLAAGVLITAVVCIIPAIYILRKKSKEQADSAEEFLRISEKYSKGDFSERIDIKVPGNLQDISRNVNLLADNVKNADDTSKTFISNVSHELRTPITTIGGFVDGILDGTIPKNRQQEYLILVSKEIKRLRVVITSMLNMSRFEAGTLKPNFLDTNLTDLVIQTVLMFEKKIEDKKLDVKGLDSERITAEIDSDLIQQVIYNLVENAVKFVNTEGTLTFTFEEDKEMCSVGIKNTGEGLKDNEIQQVFDRFYKTDSSRGKDKSGLGLGLSISRNIVRIHNGTIIVRSVYGEYTEFVVNLPKKQNSERKSRNG